MDASMITSQLAENKQVFSALLEGLPSHMYLWRAKPGKWCLLEIICHLVDEECEDFRARVMHVLETPDLPFSPIDPEGWVKERDYLKQHYSEKLEEFIEERERSIAWLKSLEAPQWKNTAQHPKLGPLTAKQLLANWLAHDYHHIRQINVVKYEYLKEHSKEDLGYAGSW